MINWPLASSSWDEKEYEVILETLKSERLTMGSKTLEMEKKFASLNGSKYCVMVNSGSSANLLMIASLFYTKNDSIKFEIGDEVIVPTVSWGTTYFPLHQLGLKTVFVDIDIKTLNIDPSKIKEKINSRTKAIFCVNLLGNPCNFDLINEIANEHKLVILEDNCESLGCIYKGKKGGSLGLMGTHSSFFSHHFSTMEGGYVTTDDDELYQILVCLRSHGWTRNLPNENFITGRKSNNNFDESFKFVLPGFNLRPLEISAACGLSQLDKIENFINQRRINAKEFKKQFSQFQDLIIQEETEQSSWFGFSIIIKEKSRISREQFLNILDKYKVAYRPIVSGNFLENPVLQYFKYKADSNNQNAELVHKNGFFLGNHHYDITDKIKLLKNTLEGKIN